MKIVYWGTYDLGKPRNRIIIKGLQSNDIEVLQCHTTIWKDIEDKSQIKKNHFRVLLLLRWLAKYPALVFKYLRLPRHHFVIIGYLGHLDVLILWPFAKLRRTPVVWDAFISLYDTVVCDRKLIAKKNPLALALLCFEWLACKAADYVLLDTEAHADFFRKKYNLSADKCFAIYVGAEQENFPVVHDHKRSKTGAISVLFYGQCIPLHGIQTILDAALLLENHSHIQWVLIGSGQEENKIQDFVTNHPGVNLEWIKWTSYETLSAYIAKTDICLGIFGISEKARRVIPNKVFQMMSCGKTIITMDSPAIRELFSEGDEGIFLVEPGSGKALAETILYLDKNRDALEQVPHFLHLRDTISPPGVTRKLIEKLYSIMSSDK